MSFKYEKNPFKKRQFNSRVFISSINDIPYNVANINDDIIETLDKYLIANKTRDLFYSITGVFIKEKDMYRRIYFYDKPDYMFNLKEGRFCECKLIVDESREEIKETVYTIPFDHLNVRQDISIYALNKNSNTELYIIREKGEIVDIYFYLYDKITQPYIKNNISSFLSLIN